MAFIVDERSVRRRSAARQRVMRYVFSFWLQLTIWVMASIALFAHGWHASVHTAQQPVKVPGEAPRVSESGRHLAAQRAGERLMAAMTAYQRENGADPENLMVLMPKYLASNEANRNIAQKWRRYSNGVMLPGVSSADCSGAPRDRSYLDRGAVGLSCARVDGELAFIYRTKVAEGVRTVPVRILMSAQLQEGLFTWRVSQVPALSATCDPSKKPLPETVVLTEGQAWERTECIEATEAEAEKPAEAGLSLLNGEDRLIYTTQALGRDWRASVLASMCQSGDKALFVVRRGTPLNEVAVRCMPD